MCSLARRTLENLLSLMNQELYLPNIGLQSIKLALHFKKTYCGIFHRAKLKLQNTTIDLQMSDCKLKTNLNILV